MPKVSKEEVENRPIEIMEATKKIYENMSFHEISFKEISEKAGLSRPTIYNYFLNKEEIFLAILEDEYKAWASDLDSIIANNEKLDSESFSLSIAKTLEKRELLLKVQCMNLYEIEEHSRKEKLYSFKVEYGKAIANIDKALIKFFPNMKEEERDKFILEFFPFMYGLFPYVHPTNKQIEAMKKAGMKIRNTTIYDATKECVNALLSKYEN